MAADYIELIRRFYARWLRDRTLDPADFHPDFVIRTPLMELGQRTHRGREGYEQWRAANDEVHTDDWFEPHEFEELGDRVLVTGWLHLTGRASGIETRRPAVQLWGFRDGKPATVTLARTFEEALEAESPAEAGPSGSG